jgi:4-hydroxy-4-methyl-2-oxoglutarate aldolase
MSTARDIDAARHTQADIARPDAALIEAARAFDCATLHEASGKRGALPSQITAMTLGLKLCGPAVTVHSPGGDNLWLHRAIYAARPGDVLVVYCNAQYEHGYWGEIMSTAARVRGLAGLIIDGCVRDSVLLRQIGLPVFARGLCIRGTGKDFGARGWINYPLLIGDVTIEAGDLVVGDEDGVVVIRRQELDTVLSAARKRQVDEVEILRKLEAGASTLDLYGWNRHAD